MIDRPQHDDPSPTVPMGGADVELGNFIDGLPPGNQACLEAARLVLGEVDGFDQVEPFRSPETSPPPARDPQDWCRRFLAGNGGCIYIDLCHTEVCVPEVTSALDFVTWWHAMLRIVRAAQIRAQATLPPDQRLELMVNNSDGQGHSYGAHLNFLLSRDAFNRIVHRKPCLTALLASFQVSSIVYAGQGKVGSENGRPDVDYQLAQRADFFDTMAGHQTTSARPLINLRDEPWSDADHARLHVIFYDANLCHVANYLKFGVLQVILAMLSADFVDVGLILDAPLDTLTAWSHDPDLRRTGRTIEGHRTTAVDHQRRFADAARRFVAEHPCPVPDADAIIDRWQATLDRLVARDWDALQRDLDWVLKRRLIEQAIDEHAGLEWSSPATKVLDHLYGNLDPARGLYLACEAGDAVTHLVPTAAIERATATPPVDTRARARAHLLRRAGAGVEARATWDSVRFTLRRDDGVESCTFHLDDPLDPEPSGERVSLLTSLNKEDNHGSS